jgi:hypothetical protein
MAKRKLPDGYRIIQGETLSGTGMGDEQYGSILQVWMNIPYRRWFKTYNHWCWANLEKSHLFHSVSDDDLILTAINHKESHG